MDYADDAAATMNIKNIPWTRRADADVAGRIDHGQRVATGILCLKKVCCLRGQSFGDQRNAGCSTRGRDETAVKRPISGTGRTRENAGAIELQIILTEVG